MHLKRGQTSLSPLNSTQTKSKPTCNSHTQNLNAKTNVQNQM